MGSTVRQLIYAALALIGLLAPWFFNMQYMQANPGPFSVAHFVAEAMSTLAGSSLTVDVGIVGVAIAVFMLVESHRLNMKIGPLNLGIPLIIYSFCIAIASGLPLFLLLRERRMRILGEHQS